VTVLDGRSVLACHHSAEVCGDGRKSNVLWEHSSDFLTYGNLELTFPTGTKARRVGMVDVRIPRLLLEMQLFVVKWVMIVVGVRNRSCCDTQNADWRSGQVPALGVR